jgi:hypothetical protein
MRTCDEHRCILLRKSNIWKRFNQGKLRLEEPYTKLRKDPKPDYRGRVAPWNQELSFVDETYPPDHDRHIVLEAHCYRLADGDVGGATGLVDPKEILIGDVLHIRLASKNPSCGLCERDGMIPLEARFHGSRYKPYTPPLSPPVFAWMKIAKKLNELRDRWTQKTFRKQTVPE